jgi:hypothetical protein
MTDPIDERTVGLLDEAVRHEVDEWGEVRPPYAAYPGTHPFDIGWRMGAGEWYLMVFAHWWAAAVPHEESRLAYLRRHPPPTQWLSWAATAVWPELADGDDDDGDGDPDDVAVRRLVDHGIGSYAAWRAWITVDDDG